MTAVFEALATSASDRDPTVRRAAIAGLVDVGPRAIERLRDSLGREDDPTNLATIARALGDWGDRVSVPELVRLLNDKNRPTALRTTILESLESSSQAAAARLALVRDSGSPPELVAHGIVRLARDGKVSADELLTFLAHADLSVRAAALKALAICPIGEIDSKSRRAISARLDDPSADVQRAAMTAISALKIDESTPRLIELAHQNDLRADAIEALTAMGRVQALPIYLDALGDRNPAIRRSAESALASIRDQVADELRSRARAGEFSGPTGQAIERILASYQPVTDWKVIGPFPRNAPDLSADSGPDAFGREHNGAGGRPIRWTSRRGDLKTGRVTLEDFEAQAGEPRDFGYDTNGSPDLAAYAYAEVQSAGEGMALARLGSSGTISVWVNSRLVHHADHAAGRPHSPVSDFLNIPLEKGVNTILVRSRQGIGTWSFSLQISDQTGSPILPTPARSPRESQREFALSHSGDPRRGKSIFFDPGGIGCAKCHSAAGQGTATVGPDLTGIGRQYDRAELIRSVLEPSSRVAAGYQPLVLATSDGTVVTGLLRGETESHIDLIDSDGKPNRLAKSELEARRVSETSLMPTGLTDSLSPSEFADLIAFLESLGKR
jgi:putative heme-binding domain-containing protein